MKELFMDKEHGLNSLKVSCNIFNTHYYTMFLDGKFILELKKTFEGERVTWVSVHKKTYWPPQDTLPEIHSSPQETTTLLSGKSTISLVNM